MELYRPGDAGFEEAAVGRVFNARRPERRPAAVLLAADERDVAAGVRLAGEEGLKVSVRAGGPSWASWSVRDDALLIDLGRMRDMTYDPATGIATANPAVKGGEELTPFLDRHGRVFTGGHCPSVGLGGFLLQGGQGWNSRRHGWGCQNVVAVDVVTAGGELLRADETQNSDLLWAARGAGPGYPAIVTRFHLRTYERPAAMTHDTWMFSLDDLEPVLEWVHDVLPRLDPIVEPVLVATRLPRPGQVTLVLHTTAMCTSHEEAAELLAPFDTCPLADRALDHQRGPTTIAEENAVQAEQNPEDHRYAVDCSWTNAAAAELAPLLRDVWSELPTEHSFSIWYGWAPQRALPDMAFSLEANVYLAVYAIWSDPADDARCRPWVHDHMRRIASEVGAGVYLGDTDFTQRPDRFMADSAFARLQEIRARRDPDGLICSYLIAPDATLNAAPARRPRTASAP